MIMKLTDIIQVLLVPVLSALCMVMYNLNGTVTEVRIQLVRVETRYDSLEKDINTLKNKTGNNVSQ